MRFPRRQLLQILSFAFGSNFIVGRNQLGVAAETAAQPAPTTGPGETAVNYGSAGGPAMEKVTGIGGLFFRAHGPGSKKLGPRRSLLLKKTPNTSVIPRNLLW